ncbi:MAG: KpsF/GutQ family sugar-phosphate isomerase [Acidobacteria bacterium]|nr:KpsF/GutQ family sugar-phosphate isomerase [Acidobacteriota bacterium]
MNDAPSAESAERRRASLDVARQVLRTEAAALEALAQDMDEAAVGDALDLLLAFDGRIVCTGMGKSGIIAKKLAGTLASTGSPAFFLHPAEAGHGDLGMIVDGDVVVALSHSGNTAEIVGLLPAMRRMGVRLIAMVGNTESTLAREADVVLHIGIEEEACPLGLAPTASTTAALALGDALAMALLEERGFGPEDFAGFHPRGSLGNQLLRVSKVMHTQEQLPQVSSDASLREAIAEMSAKGLGVTVVRGADGTVAGILTDGDVRRLMERETALEIAVSECMTPDPACIEPEALATEALRVLEERRITCLTVVDSTGCLLGVVHLHDLWRTQMV